MMMKVTEEMASISLADCRRFVAREEKKDSAEKTDRSMGLLSALDFLAPPYPPPWVSKDSIPTIQSGP